LCAPIRGAQKSISFNYLKIVIIITYFLLHHFFNCVSLSKSKLQIFLQVSILSAPPATKLVSTPHIESNKKVVFGLLFFVEEKEMSRRAAFAKSLKPKCLNVTEVNKYDLFILYVKG